MAQVPIQTGVKLQDGAFATSYPINLEHRVVDSGVSQGQLVPCRGAETLVEGPGIDRGGIYWDGLQYRVMGTKLVSIDGSTITELGDVGGSSLVRMAYGFNRLAIVSDGRLFYWDKSALIEVTDPDLGMVYDVAWIDSYFAFSDGEFPLVADLADPTSVNPLRYGSAENDPDPVTGVEKVGEELCVIGRYSLQFFDNVGGVGFPFQNIPGAFVPYGCVSEHAKCIIGGTLAFVGGGREEPLGVFLYTGGGAQRISTREIEQYLEGVDHSLIECETRKHGEDDYLIVHTPDISMQMKLRTTQGSVWNLLHSAKSGPYRPRRAVFDGVRHVTGDSASKSLAVLTDEHTRHFEAKTDWQFDVGLLFNNGSGVILEHIELFGQFPIDEESVVFLSVTRDGEVWSNERARIMPGFRGQRCLWAPMVKMPLMSGARFRGNQKIVTARCDVNGEVLSV